MSVCYQWYVDAFFTTFPLVTNTDDGIVEDGIGDPNPKDLEN